MTVSGRALEETKNHILFLVHGQMKTPELTSNRVGQSLLSSALGTDVDKDTKSTQISSIKKVIKARM